MRDHSAFFGEALRMLFFFLQERFRHEERKVGILMPGRLEHIVQGSLHLFPDRKAVRLDHHAAANGRILGEVRAFHDLVVPLGVVLRPLWKCFRHKNESCKYRKTGILTESARRHNFTIPLGLSNLAF